MQRYTVLADINGSALRSILAKKGIRLRDASRTIGMSNSYVGQSCKLNRMSNHAINEIEAKLGIPSEAFIVNKKMVPAPEAAPAPAQQAAPPKNAPSADGGKKINASYSAHTFFDIDGAALRKALDKVPISMAKASLLIFRNESFLRRCCTMNRIRTSDASLLEVKVGIPPEAYVIGAMAEPAAAPDAEPAALPAVAVHSQIDLEAIKPIIDYAIEQLRGLLSQEGVLFK